MKLIPKIAVILLLVGVLLAFLGYCRNLVNEERKPDYARAYYLSKAIENYKRDKLQLPAKASLLYPGFINDPLVFVERVPEGITKEQIHRFIDENSVFIYSPGDAVIFRFRPWSDGRFLVVDSNFRIRMETVD